MALYRKYRPATFAEVVGQEHVTDPLSTALDTGRISHAYLFSGPRGCGKTSSARILARSLNCVEGPTSTPCGVCASCVALGPGGAGNLDVIELDAASHGGVDDTRELRDRAFYAPAESRYRVFIVDEAHMVTTAGFNALLKIVEEPPAHLIFIFATTEPDKVLPTIRSRTHHYPFRLLPPATMRGLLGKICEQEHVPVEEAVYPLVIRAGGGSPRDSLSVLDQLLAGAGPEGVTYPRAVSLLGVTDVALIDDAIDALAAVDGAALFGTIDSVMEAGHDPRRFAVDLLERLRDLILLRAVPDAAERGLVSGPGGVLERMRDQAERLGPATLTRYAELLHEGLGEMRGATAPRLLLEVICARMLLPSVSDAESATLQRLERLERGFAGGAVPSAPARPGPAAGEPSPEHAAPSERPAPRPAGAESRRRGAELLAAARAEKEAAAGGSATPHRERPAAGGPVAFESTAQAPAQQNVAPAPAGQQNVAPAPAGQQSAAPASADRQNAAAASADRQSAAAASAGRQSVAAAPSSSVEEQGSAAGQPGPAIGGAAVEGSAAQSHSGAALVSDGGAVVLTQGEAPIPGVEGEAAQAVSRSGAAAPAGASPSRDIEQVADDTQRPAAAREQAAPQHVAPHQVTAPQSAVSPASVAGTEPAGQAPAVMPEVPPRQAPAQSVVSPHESTGPQTAAPRQEPAAAPQQPAASASQQPAASQQPSASQSPAAPAEDLVALVDGAWAEIKGKVREFGPTLQALLSGAAVSRAEGDVIVFAHQSPPLAQRLSDPRNIDAVRSAVRAVLGRELDVRWETGAPAPRPAAKSASAARGTGQGEAKPAGRPKFSRPSQAGGGQQAGASGQAKSAADDDIPPPDFPDLPDDPGPDEGYGAESSRSGGDSGRGARPGDAVLAPPTPEEEQEMLAAAAEPVAPGDRQDPDEVALALLRDELGAKSLDG
ncbi:DNA polymerase III subunit gamma and tau [Nocardia sp. MH4]|uniref:DNA polymerase III subunit gamma and tau n=1 Tax=Nocardia sp. MH4 TaxID=1768677 RepID=UPI001C4EC153|nr:DNA polymerase III subunit gamma and tau [Nocardia sp. MH4]